MGDMITIDESYVDSLAPASSAIKNGRDIVRKGKLIARNKTEDGKLYFGECSGSGKSNYFCSVDFIQEDNPVSRCSCPSRQFPCKHCLGLLYALAFGESFTVAEIPEDVASKRAKSEERAEKRKEAAKKPKKVNKSALKKKIGTQMEGLDLLEKLTQDLVRNGVGNISPKTASQVEEQSKQLANAFLPGARFALRELTLMFRDMDQVKEHTYTEALDQLTRLNAIVKRGREYLQARLDDPELKPETGSSIAAWLGHAWKLEELREAGLVEKADLAQLSFICFDSPAREEFVDLGIWMNLNTGAIQQTCNYRPYKASKFIKEDDSVFHVVQAEELFIYPGDLNPRVRWDSHVPRDMAAADVKKIRSLARKDLAAAIKEVKGQLKSPLASKNPLLLLEFAQIGKVGDDYVLEDKSGQRLVLTDRGETGDPPSLHLLQAVPKKALKDQAVLLRFAHDWETHTLKAKPLTLVTKDSILRLTF